MKTGILVCSNSGLDYVNYNNNIKIMRLILNIENKEYKDFVDISADEFYEKITNDKKLKISTTQPPTGEIVDLLEEFKSEGYTDVVVVTISSKLSGTFSGASLASGMVDGLNVHLFDSKSVSYIETYMVNEASKMALDNKKPEEIRSYLENIRSNNKLYFCVDTLHYLVLNGRLSALNGMLGNILKIKPLLTITEEGVLTTLEKIRTKSKAKERMVEILADETAGKDIFLYAIYTNNQEEAEELLNTIKLATKANILGTDLVPLTPVVGCHAGPKTFGIGYVVLEK